MEDGGTPHVHAGPEQTPVVATRCTDYEFEAVRAALRRVLAPLGGMAAFVLPGRAHRAQTQSPPGYGPGAGHHHPSGRGGRGGCRGAGGGSRPDRGGEPRLGDRAHSGLDRPCLSQDRLPRGGRTLRFRTQPRHGLFEAVSHPEGRLVRRFEVMDPILKADGVINLCKFKTHTFQTFTGATKNLFGVIPGLNKVGISRQVRRPRALRRDAAGRGGLRASPTEHHGLRRRPGGQGARAPAATPGPSASCWPGPTQWPSTSSAAASPVSTRRPCRCWWPRGSAACGAGARQMSTPWGCRWPTCRCRTSSCRRARPGNAATARWGWWSGSPGRFCGEASLPCRGQRRSAARGARRASRPVPPEAMSIGDEVAKVDDDLCIRCYCCHEVCPYAAIDLEFTGFGRVVNRLGLAG